MIELLDHILQKAPIKLVNVFKDVKNSIKNTEKRNERYMEPLDVKTQYLNQKIQWMRLRVYFTLKKKRSVNLKTQKQNYPKRRTKRKHYKKLNRA